MPYSFLSPVLLASAALVCINVGWAEEADYNFNAVSPQVKNICSQAAQITPPAADQPNETDKKILTGCSANDFYYGFNQPANWVKARECAYATHNYAVLAMIYANGQSVQRNWDLAIQFACKAGFAPEEITGRVMHLVHLRDQHSQQTDFDFCDDVTSGYMMGICAAQQEQSAKAQRQQRLASLTLSWSDARKQAFQRLQQAANVFFAARSANEVDLSGTARDALETEEQSSLQNDLLDTLQDVIKAQIPKGLGQLAAVDQQLNNVYQKIETNTDFSVGTVDRAGVKKTQQAWLKYRDAWIAFAKAQYPQVNLDAFTVWLTRKRLKMLEDLSE